MMNIAIREYAVATPFGNGIEPLWNALIEKRSALTLSRRVETANFAANKSAELPLPSDSTESLVWSLMEPLRREIASWNADHLILATTKGEVDLLEREIRGNVGSNRETTGKSSFPNLGAFLSKAMGFFGIPEGTLVSGACASSNMAIQRAAEMLLSGKSKRAVVVGVDIVSKFVFSGFSALQALSAANKVRPFDRDRDGLLLGEACAAVLLEKSAPATDALAAIAGWGHSSDANHVTGPSRDGSGLARAIRSALDSAGLPPDAVSAVSAHGTGTIYNDAMEIRAFDSVFPKSIPAFSIKGATGHTMGTAGVLETVVAVEALREGVLPSTVGLENPDPLAAGWVSTAPVEIADGAILNVNSGFGGINAALLLTADV
jgi:3-oxoacyl-[acyl-carrier-protein] synthase II